MKKGSFDEKFEERIYSHTLARPVNNEKGILLFDAGQVIDVNVIKALNEHNVKEVHIRSVLTCESEG